jgi:hypothetical protein
MAENEMQTGGSEQVFRPCGRAFFVYYVAMAICFLGPYINPEIKWLPPWLGLILGLFVLAAVLYMSWGQEYHLTPRGVAKVWLWPSPRRQEITWENLGEVLVRRGLTQTLMCVGNLLIRDKAGSEGMFWFGLANPKEIKALMDERRRT